MKALVTGGAGFIASRLADRLLSEGYDVTAMDNLTEDHLANLAHLKKEMSYSFVKADLKDARAVVRLVKGMDVVFHLAAQANIRRSLVDYMADLDNNLVGTINILEGMIEWKVKEMLFASTSAIYGEATVRPTSESYMPVQNSLYGSSKMACMRGIHASLLPVLRYQLMVLPILQRRRRALPAQSHLGLGQEAQEGPEIPQCPRRRQAEQGVHLRG